MDVVGTAYVRIRALTDQLNKDVKDKVTKSLQNSELDKIASAEGKELGGNLGDGMADEAESTLKKRSKTLVPSDDINDGFKNTFKGVKNQFEQLDIFDDVAEKFDQLDLFDDDAFDFDFSVSTLEADKDSQGFFSRLKAGFKSVGDDIDKGPLKKSLDGLDARFKKLGQGGNMPGIGRLGKTLGLVGGAIIGALPYIQDVGAAVLAYATGLVAQIGFLSTALVGVGAAAGAAIGSAALAALPILLAFKAETDTLTDFKDSLTAAGQEFQRIGVATQQTLLPALDDAIFAMGDLIPMFSEFGLFVGQIVGSYAQYAAGILTGSVAQERFSKILQASLTILDDLFPTLINIGNILSGIWVAAIPAAERFSDIVRKLTNHWSEMVTEGLRTGELTSTIDLWFDRAVQLGRALGNVSGALFDILEVGGTSAGDVFTRFDEWAARFRAFTESEAGQNRLALIFDNALEVMREVNAIAADLFDGIFGRLGNVGGVDSMVASLEKFRDVIPQIQEFWAQAYDAIKGVVELFASNVWENIKQAWEQMAEPLGRLTAQIMDLFKAMHESGAFDVFLDLMEILTDVLTVLLDIPGFGQFIAYMIAFNGAIKVASIALSPFLRLFGTFGSLMTKLVAGALTGQLLGTAGALGRLTAAFKAANAASASGGLIKGIQGGLAAAKGLSQTAKTTAAVAGQTGKAAADAAKAVAGTGTSGFAGAIGTAAGSLGAFAIPLAAVGGALAIGAGVWAYNAHQAHKWEQEIRQATEAIGLFNDGLNVTADGVANYVKESSRFDSHDQIDDLRDLGLTVDALGKSIAEGSLSYVDFADKALQAGQITAEFVGTGSLTNQWRDTQIDSLRELGNEYDLTSSQLEKLAKGQQVVAKDGTTLLLRGNNSLLDSFEELNNIIGESAKKSVDEFASNATNIELLGADTLNKLVADVDKASNRGAVDRMIDAQSDLQKAGRAAFNEIDGLSNATRDQILLQATAADGTIQWATAYQLASDAVDKQNKALRESLDVFNSMDFAIRFGDAKDAVIDFSTVVANTDLSAFNPEDNIDVMLDKFPQVASATSTLFDQLSTLPVEQFNAAAAAIGVDADALRGAMEGAEQAIVDLQETAIGTLPSIGKLLDEATETKEDGSQIFNKEAFVKSVKDRVQTTKDFSKNITDVQARLGDEAARMAAEQGPEAAKNLASITGTNADQLKTTLDEMAAAEEALKIQIRDKLGPGIKFEYAAAGGLFGGALGGGVAAGLNSDATINALKDSSLDTLNELAAGFQGEFVWENGKLTFKYTGHFRRTRKQGIRPTLNPDTRGFAVGGFVKSAGIQGAFNRSFGTDTVPAMLTPGEFVNTRATVDRLGVGFFNALNSGSTPATPVPVGGGGTAIDASGWQIVAPTPEESGRQMVSRFRSLSFLLGEN